MLPPSHQASCSGTCCSELQSHSGTEFVSPSVMQINSGREEKFYTPLCSRAPLHSSQLCSAAKGICHILKSQSWASGVYLWYLCMSSETRWWVLAFWYINYREHSGREWVYFSIRGEINYMYPSSASPKPTCLPYWQEIKLSEARGFTIPSQGGSFSFIRVKKYSHAQREYTQLLTITKVGRKS